MPQVWLFAGAEGEESCVGIDTLRAACRLGSVAAVKTPADRRAVHFDAAGVGAAGAEG